MRPTDPRDITDRNELAEFFADRPDVHIYGLGDLEEPFWSPSRWIRRGDAVVGFVRLAEATTPMVYAVSTRDPAGTLDLLVDHLDRLPAGTLITGPVGLAARVGTVRERIDMGPHVKMVLDERPDQGGDASPTSPPSHAATGFGLDAVPLVPLGPADLAAIEALLAVEPGAAFFSASMLADRTFVGARPATGDDALVAVAGTHVVSERHGVAAVGAVFTHPDHRGKGLGGAVTLATIDRLRDRLGDQLGDRPAVIGLNVAASNEAARRAYARIGFRECWTYEEVELQ